MRTRSFQAWLLSIGLILALLPLAVVQSRPAVAEPFRAYYETHHGLRMLGAPLTALIEVDGYPAQYFEKGRLEDHYADGVGGDWAIMSGRVAAELLDRAAATTANGTSLTYATLRRRNIPQLRHPVPEGFTAGVLPTDAGVFVPYDPQLRPAPGYLVALRFWEYITNAGLFPDGWMHDVGLPLTDAFMTRVYKNGQVRDITVQVFERALLTDDPLNAAEWQIERGNIGADAVRVLPPQNTIELPAPGARVTLPLAVLARVGWPGQVLSLTLRWENGSKLFSSSTVLRGEDGRGLVIDCMALPLEYQSQHPWTQPAQLEISNSNGTLLATQPINVLHPDDPDTQEISLFWIEDGRLTAEQRHIVQTSTPEAAAVEALLWGPAHKNADGSKPTALPTPEQVLAYSGRTSEWDSRVTLRSLTLRNGLATADFSQELRAYDGDAQRASLIHAQITRTLLQFESVHDVTLTIDGRRDWALEPSGPR
ncbi:MAG TPA: GerMN domain-containing protein [Roseiflexaceae bacterium]|nr:GerMN domain-containing protein [Roseiflexaceae bacterium]